MLFHVEILIVCSLIFANYVSAVNEAQLKSAAKLLKKNCQPKSKVTNDIIENMHKGQWNGEPEAQCYAFCILDMYKLVDKSGVFNEESALKQVDVLPKPRQAPILLTIENCKGKSEGKDKCETAYNFLKCVYFDNTENYFFP